jgi:hypothetical protein
MHVRHWLGDAGLAVLLALPTATLARPSVIFPQSPASVSPPHGLALATSSRFSLTR